MPTFMPFEEFKDGFTGHGFHCLCAMMMKNHKTGNPMPLYLCNIAPCEDFGKIYQIKSIGLMSVTTE